jgi:membrane fusion protein (multidrug efflux system)
MSNPESPQIASPAPRAPRRMGRLLKGGVLASVVLGGLVLAALWVRERRALSITDDAFLEAHLVNVAPELVSGRIVRILVEENDTVGRGQLIAEIDPVPYIDRVRLSQAKLDAAIAEQKRQEADLERLRVEIPIQIEIAGRTSAAAGADLAKAGESVKLTRDEVEKGIDEARAGVSAAQADMVLAQQEYERWNSLFRQDATTLRRSQEVTRSRDASRAQLNLAEARLAKAQASRAQIDVAERGQDAARRSAEKADKGIELSRTGKDQIRVLELLSVVKGLAVEEARRGLEAAQHDLEHTEIHAPFPGVIVKRYRHMGDFASAGVSVVSMYNPEVLYVEANLEETRLPGVAPGNEVEIELDAFNRPFRGRVLWINKSTGAQFALMPRNVVSGEFTKVVQRVPVRIAIERDGRWGQLRAGLSARVAIEHGPGDPEWAAKESRRLVELEGRSDRAPLDAAPADRGRR